MNTNDILSALDGGTSAWNRIVGTAESSELEFKGTPPLPLERDGSGTKYYQLELAKDVSCLANSRGGLILFGAKTNRNELNGDDEVASIDPFPSKMFDPTRIDSIIRQYVYPAIDGLEIQRWPGEGGDALGSIRVPPQDPAARPFIVTEGAEPDGPRLTNYVGVFRRINSSCIADSTETLHEALRTGQGLRDLLGGQTTSTLESVLEASSPNVLTEEALDERLEEEEDYAGIGDAPRVFVQAQPDMSVDVPTIQSRGWEGLRSRFERPPSLRTHGFNLRQAVESEVLPTGGLRRRVRRDAALSLLPQGLVTIVVGPELLGWANDKQRFTRGAINQMALVEFVFEFCRFVEEQVVPAAVPRPNRVAYRIGFRDLDKPPNSIVEGWPMEAFPFADPSPAASPEFNDGLVVEAGSPGGSAYALLARLYRAFGVGPEEIPFVTEESIDAEKITARN